MSPLPPLDNAFQTLTKREKVDKPTDPAALVLEAWAEGYMVGSLIIMSCISTSSSLRSDFC